MEKLLIPQDKANHFIYGFLIYFLCNLVFNEMYSFVIICVVASLKEIIYDNLLGKGTSDYKDFLYSILAGVLLLFKAIFII